MDHVTSQQRSHSAWAIVQHVEVATVEAALHRCHSLPRFEQSVTDQEALVSRWNHFPKPTLQQYHYCCLEQDRPRSIKGSIVCKDFESNFWWQRIAIDSVNLHRQQHYPTVVTILSSHRQQHYPTAVLLIQPICKRQLLFHAFQPQYNIDSVIASTATL